VYSTGVLLFFVGSEVGRPSVIGFPVGRSNGRPVGFDIGLVVGLELGFDVGFVVGWKEGLDAGAEAGPTVSLDIGINDGLDVGFFVGLDDGLIEGFGVIGGLVIGLGALVTGQRPHLPLTLRPLLSESKLTQISIYGLPFGLNVHNQAFR
jgi:hypothetical protein